jgi:hypothetical protein
VSHPLAWGYVGITPECDSLETKKVILLRVIDDGGGALRHGRKGGSFVLARGGWSSLARAICTVNIAPAILAVFKSELEYLILILQNK